MPARGLFAAVVAAVCLLHVSCTPQEHGPRSHPDDRQSSSEAAAPFSEEECNQFAQTWTQAIQAKDPSKFATVLELTVVLRSAMANIEVPDQARQRFVAEMKGDAKRPGDLFAQLFDLVKQGASYKFLHRHSVQNHERLLFRLLLPDGGGVNYHDVLLERFPDGQMKGVDVYILTNGELLSETARRAYLLDLSRQSQIAAARLQGAERQYHDFASKLLKLNQYAREGRHQEVLNLYDQLPADLQKDKNVLLIRLQAAQAVGDDRYAEAIGDFRTFHPDDPCIDFFSITYYIQTKAFAKALDMIGRVERAIGGDPYLHVFRALVHTEANDLPAARKSVEKAISEEPTLAEAYWELVRISMLEKKFAETLERLREIERRFAPKFPDMTTLPAYAEFVKSPQYQEWLKSHKSP